MYVHLHAHVSKNIDFYMYTWSCTLLSHLILGSKLNIKVTCTCLFLKIWHLALSQSIVLYYFHDSMKIKSDQYKSRILYMILYLIHPGEF